jgi:5'-nucleotidase
VPDRYKKQLLVDMDGVLADIYAQYIRYETAESGRTQKVEDLYGIPEDKAFVNCEKYVRMRGFFRHAPVIRGSVEGLKYLNDQYRVFVVSSATEYPQSLEEKFDWLTEHFPFISWKQMIFCGSKAPIKGDIMVDDHLKNLDLFEGKTILFTQPHNFKAASPKHIRAHNWEDLLHMLNS